MRSTPGCARWPAAPAVADGPREPRLAIKQLRKDGAEGGTRTPTGCPTRPSNVRVCQFRHFGAGAWMMPCSPAPCQLVEG
jgi:hypothetical protein